MKKSEFTQLTQIIECIVAKEIRKQLPIVISEVFQNMMGKTIVTETKQPNIPKESSNTNNDDLTMDLKTSLKELFAGNPIIKAPDEIPSVQQPPPLKQYTSNPKYNQILNETVSDLKQRERLVGAAAFQGGYSPSLNMVPGFNPNTQPMMSPSEEPSFTRNIPVMSSNAFASIAKPPVLVEGQESTHAPLAIIPEGTSVLDIVKQVPAPAAVTQALTRNYSQLMRVMNAKDKKKA